MKLRSHIDKANHWLICTIDDICLLTYGKGLKSNQLLQSGYNVYGANGIIGFYNEYLYEKSKVIISCRGAASGAIHKTEPKSFITSNSIVFHFDENYIIPDYFHFAIESRDMNKIVTGSAQPQITIESLKKLEFPLTTLNVQLKIVEKLKSIIGQIKDIKERESNVLQLEELAFKNFISKDNIPYTNIQLSEFCKERTERIGEKWRGKKLIGVSNEQGITVLRVGGKKTFEKYKIVHPGDFVYNPMRVDIGSIAIWDDKEIALTSPDYIVFSITNEVSPALLLKYLKSSFGLSEIKNNTQGSVRSRLYFKNLANVNFPFEDFDSQKEAQAILENFKQMRKETNDIVKKVEEVKKEAFQRVFESNFFEFEHDNETVDVLLEKIKESKKELFSSQTKNLITQRTNKMTKEKTVKKSIIDVLIEKNSPMIAKDVWQASIHYKDIDAFYSSLKLLIEVEKTVSVVKQGNERYLKLSK